jgi:hypothetical protein
LKVEPVIDKAALVETARQEYGLSIESLTFFPTSWVACCYVANCADGERYFLKLRTDSGLMPFAASDLMTAHIAQDEHIATTLVCDAVVAIDARIKYVSMSR